MAGPIQKSDVNRILDEITEAITLAAKGPKTNLDKLLPVKTEFKVTEKAALAALKLSEAFDEAIKTKEGYKKLVW